MTDLRARAPGVISVAEARVEVARVLGEPVELGYALAELARVSVEEPRQRSELLVEAAQAAARSGDTEISLARAREAARLAPDVASTQLFARGLEYRLRGAGSKDDAFATIASLDRLGHPAPVSSRPSGNAETRPDVSLEPEDVALRAFLLAEAEDVVHGPGGGAATLKECLAAVGAQPLVALGLAERAAREGRHEEAYRFYTEAVYGNLLGLRRPGRVAIAAADSAAFAGDTPSTQRFLNEAAKDPETRAEALRRIGKFAVSKDDTVKARAVLRGLAEGLEGKDRAEVLAELARVLLASPNPSERLEGDRTMREAIDFATEDLATTLRGELESFRGRAPPEPPPVVASASEAPAPAGKPPRLPSQVAGRAVTAEESPTRVVDTKNAAAPAPAPSPRSPEQDARSLSSQIPGLPKVPPAPPPLLVTPDEEAPIMSVRHVPLGSERPPPPPPPAQPASSATEIPTTPAGKVAKARARLLHGSAEEAERLLTEALREGAIEAADLLDQLLKDEPSRRAALLKVRRQAVELNPGNLTRLHALRDAAKADQNPNYMRAIEHVLRAFDKVAGPLAPPPLTAQSAQPGMLTLLTRHSQEPAGEAFGEVWDGAAAIFAKTAAAAGMTGLERVVPGPTSALSRLYEAALRLLDTPRFALFHDRTRLGRPRRGPSGTSEVSFEDDGLPLELGIALLATPAAVLSGDVREDSADLRWVVGQALSCVLPQNALVLGFPDARALWGVILGAFGPPGAVQVERKDAALADMLWQTLAPRMQRRLKDLLGTAEPTPFELVTERAKQSGRRVGMFLTGDFGHAVRAVMAEFPQAKPAELDAPDGLERLCTQLPAVADMLRLAVRPEYADARWHLPAAASQRLALGRLPPV
jgi:hypothetical protein